MKKADALVLQKVISSNVRDQRKISIEWMEVWEEIENWYGDIQQKETGQELVERLQSKYDLRIKGTTERHEYNGIVQGQPKTFDGSEEQIKIPNIIDDGQAS